MKKVYNSIEECCGCEACSQICPIRCISMEEDERGFLFPVINQKVCIDCKKCYNSCLYHNSTFKNIDGKCYVYVNNNEQYRKSSASSGAFEAICKAFSAQHNDIVVFGSEFTSDLQAKHGYCLTLPEIKRFKKSKYIQSKIGDSFIKTREFLESGKYVIFSGTPCQIAALRIFLKKKYDNLLTIDFICHGVPNQKIFDEYIKTIIKKYKSKVKYYTFRKKKYIDNAWENLGIEIELLNGRKIYIHPNKDMYMTGFLSGLFNRDSCYTCPFASTQRVSDITIGDFWGIDNYREELSERITNGTSLILINNPRFSFLIPLMNREAYIEEVSINIATPYNAQLTSPQKMNKERERFFNYFVVHGFKKSIKHCFPERFGFKSKYRNFKEYIYKNKMYIWASTLKNKLRNNEQS